jgi:phage tail protein X
MAKKEITIRSEGTTLSAVVWSFYRSTAPGLVERVMRDNPGTSDNGVFLPIGTVVTLDLDLGATTPAPRKIVRLWG